MLTRAATAHFNFNLWHRGDKNVNFDCAIQSQSYYYTSVLLGANVLKMGSIEIILVDMLKFTSTFGTFG
jgi:hypothetical protein